MPATSSEGKLHYLTLDAMRGIAALSVVIMHWSNGLGFKGYFDSSILAVDFFFMLSGFVVAYSYQQRLINGFSFSKFLLLRIIRLQPLILFGAFLGMFKLEVKSLLSTGSLDFGYVGKFVFTILLIPENVLHLLFNTELNPLDQFFPLNFAFWSLFFEFIMYVLYGSLLFRLQKHQLIVLMSLALIGVSYWIKGSFSVSDTDNTGGPSTTLTLGLCRAVFFYSFGLLIFKSQNLLSPLWGKLPKSILILLPVLFFLPRSWLPWYLTEILAISIFTICIFVGISRKNSNAKLERFLGDISYPIYALHIPLIWGITFFIKRGLGLTEPEQIVWLGFLAIPISVLLSYVALKIYDEPVRNWLKGKI